MLLQLHSSFLRKGIEIKYLGRSNSITIYMGFFIFYPFSESGSSPLGAVFPSSKWRERQREPMTFMWSWCLKCIEGKTLIGIKSIFFDERVLQLFFPFAILKGCNPKGHPPEFCRVPLHLSLPQLALLAAGVSSLHQLCHWLHPGLVFCSSGYCRAIGLQDH